MFKSSLVKAGISFFLVFASYNSYAQYTVTGGTGAPLLALSDSRNDIDIYLVYGTDGVRINYASASDSHQWFRYKTKALEAEPVTAQQSGTASVLAGIEDGYGYFVKSTTGLTKYVWIIDYSRYQVELNSLTVSDELSSCDGVWLDGDATITPLYYYTPLGNRAELKRSFELTYTTSEWNENANNYLVGQEVMTIEGNPLKKLLTPPFADTDYTLKGDLFARHFGVEQTVRSDLYTAVGVSVRVDTTFLNEARLLDDGVYSAPLEMRFTAYANEPVANNFSWTIYNKEDSTRVPFNYRGSEIEHTFALEGTYAVELKVTDRTGRCEADPVTYEFTLSDFYWDAPNVFSPGSSPGINDEFKIVYKSILSFKGWIFNRWGNELFHWTNPDGGWDGKKGGKYVAPGVYYYVLEAKGSDGKTHKKTGSISILRPKTTRNEVIE